jgi:hypothetical protein
MKFTLISDNEFGGPKITYEFEEDFLESIVENFEQFLKGSGFVFESLEVNQTTLENSSWDHDDDFGDDDDDDDDEEGYTPTSTAWPFPMNRPQEETGTEPSEK